MFSPSREWRKPGRSHAASRRIEDGNVGEFPALLHATQHQSTTAHIAPAYEFHGKQQTLAKYFEQGIHVLCGRNTAQKNDIAPAFDQVA